MIASSKLQIFVYLSSFLPNSASSFSSIDFVVKFNTSILPFISVRMLLFLPVNSSSSASIFSRDDRSTVPPVPGLIFPIASMIAAVFSSILARTLSSNASISAPLPPPPTLIFLIAAKIFAN